MLRRVRLLQVRQPEVLVANLHVARPVEPSRRPEVKLPENTREMLACSQWLIMAYVINNKLRVYLHRKSLLQEEKLVQEEGTIVEGEGVDTPHIVYECEGVYMRVYLV